MPATRMSSTPSVTGLNTAPTPYTGRFAPSPTGPLHFGSIIAALGSFLDARHSNGRWLVRMEDIDRPRVADGAAASILNTLEQLHLCWDGEVVYQSSRTDAYDAALAILHDRKQLYPCSCSRKLNRGRPYPGTCRERNLKPEGDHSLRVKTDAEPLTLNDMIQGDSSLYLMQDSGDFIVRRSDRIHAYHLAVVVDDHWQGVNHIVRGVDLLESTPSQLHLQRLLEYPTPRYAHLPIAVTATGRKISKQNHARDVMEHASPAAILLQALTFLGQQPSQELAAATPAEVLQWGIANWEIGKVPRRKTIAVAEYAD